MDLFSEFENMEKPSSVKNDVLSVSAYLDLLNLNLKAQKARILGEVCNVQMYEGRSYMYFSIKDSKDQSTAKCFMWKNDYRISGVTLRDGMEVIVTAYPNIYKPNGGLTLQVEHVELQGEGALQKAYEELKKKLDKEGLFREDRKRKIPDYPHKIGVITSKSGAVINDFLSNIGKFGFEISFVDSKVEGQDAIKDLLAAVRTLSKKNIDVLVIMRGGGSLESFLAFNNEMLIRAVADFPVPVLTGIGHDKDAPLISLVSDMNVSTPTAVTHILNKSWNEALSLTRIAEEKIFSNFSADIKDAGFILENSEVAIERSFLSLFETFHQAKKAVLQATKQIERDIVYTFDVLEQRAKEICHGFENIVYRTEERIKQSGEKLEYVNPLRQLARGYSIVKNKGKILRKTSDVSKGEKLDITLSDGIIEAIVE